MTTEILLTKIERMLREEFDAEIGRIENENVIGVTDIDGDTWFITIEKDGE